MSKREKILKLLMSDQSGRDFDFEELCSLLKRIGFRVRVHGDHHIFTKDGILEIINLQPINGKAKPYQVRQVRNLLRAYRFDEDNEWN